MRHRLTLAAAICALPAILTPVAAAADPPVPDPAPHGPQRPYEPDVAGPVNISTVEAVARRDGAGHQGIVVSIDARTHTATGEKPAAPRRHVFLFDTSIRFNPLAFPTCSRAVIERLGISGCPAGSQVGSGRVELFPAGAADIAVFNTRYPNSTRGMLITIPAVGGIFENTFERASRPYRHDFRWASDEIIPPDPTPPQYRGANSRFQISFGATYRGHSFLESTAPTGSPLRFGGHSEFVTGQVTLLTGQVSRP
jgi:hypothetical protein